MPATGVDWADVYGYDTTQVRKGLIVTVLIRDYQQSITSLTGFTPFADDGELRGDLLDSGFAGGRWYDVGALSEDGVESSPKIDTDKTKILQSINPARVDLTNDEEMIKIPCRESTPLQDYLRFNLPLKDGVPAIGDADYVAEKPSEWSAVERQLIVLTVDGDFLIGETYPRVSLSDIGKVTRNRKSPMDQEITYDRLIDPYTLGAGGSAANVLIHRGGAGWVASGS